MHDMIDKDLKGFTSIDVDSYWSGSKQKQYCQKKINFDLKMCYHW